MVAVWRGNAADLRRAIYSLPAVFSGRLPDAGGVARGLALRLGVAFLSQVQQDFVTKARGGTGRDGIKWKPLAPSTVARRRLGPGDRKAVRLAARAPALSQAQRRAVDKDVRVRKAALMLKGLTESQALGVARSAAEAKYRRGGQAASKFSVLSARDVEILRDTNRLFRSLQPGIEDRPARGEGQVFDAGPGRVTVGSDVVYAARQHADRPFWPERLPPAWRAAINAAFARGVARALELMTRGR